MHTSLTTFRGPGFYVGARIILFPLPLASCLLEYHSTETGTHTGSSAWQEALLDAIMAHSWSHRGSFLSSLGVAASIEDSGEAVDEGQASSAITFGIQGTQYPCSKLCVRDIFLYPIPPYLLLHGN